MGSWVCSGGAYSARIPSPRSVQPAPPSSVNQIPPVETAIHTRRELRGSTQIEWIPGRSAPPPIHCLRLADPRASGSCPTSARDRSTGEARPRERSTPKAAGLVAATGLECPNACRAPIERPAPHVVLLVAVRFGRIGRRSDLLPPVRGRAVKLDAEMTVVECRITAAVAPVAQC